MESNLGTVAVKELQSVVREIQRHGIRNNTGNWIVTFHFVFGGASIIAWLGILACKLTGYEIGDHLIFQYLFSLATSVMLFAVGTLMIEQMRGDLPAAVLGRMLAGCGLFVMSAQGYEFMQKSRLCELNMELMAKQHSAKEVEYQPVSYLRESEHNGFKVSWESEYSDGRSRPMFSAGRCSTTSDVGIAAKGGSVHRMPRSKPGTATDGTSAVY